MTTSEIPKSTVPDTLVKVRLIDQLPSPKDVARDEANIGIPENRVNDAFVRRTR